MSDADESSLVKYFQSMQLILQAKLRSTSAMHHPGAKGDETENTWVDLLAKQLPARYVPISKVFIIDHKGGLSNEIDIVIADRQYTPLIVSYETRTYVPAEAVYAAIEVKPTLNSGYVEYAGDMVASVRRLVRTNASIVDARGLIEHPRNPEPILGILLATKSEWSPAFSSTGKSNLLSLSGDRVLNLGCVAEAGTWERIQVDGGDKIVTSSPTTALGSFLFTLLTRLQGFGTVPAMEYSIWHDALERAIRESSLAE